jgi:hypothetical protein
MGARPTANCSRPTAAVETSPQTSGILGPPSIREFTPSATPPRPSSCSRRPQTRRDETIIDQSRACHPQTNERSRRATSSPEGGRLRFPRRPRPSGHPEGGVKTSGGKRGKRAQLNFYAPSAKNGGATLA